MICLGLRPAGDFGKSDAEPSDCATNAAICLNLCVCYAKLLETMMCGNYVVLAEAVLKTWQFLRLWGF